MAREWRVGAGGQEGAKPWQGCLLALALPHAGGKREKVLHPRAGVDPKPGVGQGPQAASGEMDRYDQSYTRKN
jgi:hypothetical protein